MFDPEEMSPEWLLARATEREHVVAAVALGQARWRELGEVIARSSDADDARRSIAVEFQLDDVQARAILDTQFRRISAADRTRITQEHDELRQHISQLKDQIAADPDSARRAPPTAPAPAENRGWWGYEPRE